MNVLMLFWIRQPTVLTKAARYKLAMDRNILSVDAGIHINQLTTLCVRPNTVTSATFGNKGGFGNNPGKSKKKVVFQWSRIFITHHLFNCHPCLDIPTSNG